MLDEEKRKQQGKGNRKEGPKNAERKMNAFVMCISALSSFFFMVQRVYDNYNCCCC